jgi:lysophospholipase L1-like esterase
VLTRNTVDLSNISQAIFAPSIGTTANGSVASPALGYNAEDLANKQNSLLVDGTGSKYPTVDAVNVGLQTALNGKENKKYIGENWGIVGDSFTQLGFFQPTLVNQLGVSFNSDGFGGSCITGGTGNAEGDAIYRTPIIDRVDAMLANTISCIIIQGGSNDFHYNVPLGKFEDTSPLTFYGAMRVICEKIANSPNAVKAVFITPTFRSDLQKTGGSSGLENMEKMKNYVNAMKAIAYEYSYQVVDAYNSGINFYNADIFTTDGVHPNNTAGTKLYSNYLIDNINNSSQIYSLDGITKSSFYAQMFKTLYINKGGANLNDDIDTNLIITNGIDADLRLKTTAIGASLKYNSIGTSKNIPLALNETGGFVGIGLTNPNTTLHVKSNSNAQVLIDNSSTSTNSISLLTIKTSNSTFGGGLAKTSNTEAFYDTNSLLVYTYDNEKIVFGTNNIKRAVISENGNFGINQPNPTERLDVVGNGRFSGTIKATGLAVYADNAAATSGGLTAGTMYRTSVGDVMIVY